MSRSFATVVASAALACSSVPPVAEYTTGSHVAPVTLSDQFAVEHTLDEGVALVLFTRDMDVGGVIKAVLAEHPDALPRNRAVYVADISGMPSFIARLAAIPKMKERPYPTLLDRDALEELLEADDVRALVQTGSLGH